MVGRPVVAVALEEPGTVCDIESWEPVPTIPNGRFSIPLDSEIRFFFRTPRPEATHPATPTLHFRVPVQMATISVRPRGR